MIHLKLRCYVLNTLAWLLSAGCSEALYTINSIDCWLAVYFFKVEPQPLAAHQHSDQINTKGSWKASSPFTCLNNTKCGFVLGFTLKPTLLTLEIKSVVCQLSSGTLINPSTSFSLCSFLGRYAFHLWRPLGQIITEAAKKVPSAVSVIKISKQH